MAVLWLLLLTKVFSSDSAGLTAPKAVQGASRGKVSVRFRILAQFVVKSSTANVGQCVVRVKLYNLVEVLDGALVLAQLAVSITTVVVGYCVVRVKLDGLVVVFDGTLPTCKTLGLTGRTQKDRPSIFTSVTTGK